MESGDTRVNDRLRLLMLYSRKSLWICLYHCHDGAINITHKGLDQMAATFSWTKMFEFRTKGELKFHGTNDGQVRH